MSGEAATFSPLERVALHQTRLRTPGLSIDPSGVALGAQALVLLPTVERLIAFLATYTAEHSFAELIGDRASESGESLAVSSVKSALGTREVALVLPAASPTQVDVLADVARLVGGLAFTGSGRYFVQYRDRQAPFGYDAVSLLRVERDDQLALHHSTFTQVYAREREVDLASLMARLSPRIAPAATALSARPLWIVAPMGVGGALIRYFARSAVDADAAIVELPPSSSFDDRPERLTLLRVNELPPRMRALVGATPGITAFLPAGAGGAVQVGHRHPVHLTGLPVFDPQGLVLIFAPSADGQRPPMIIERLPTLGPVAGLVTPQLADATRPVVATAAAPTSSLPLHLAPSAHAPTHVTASLVDATHAPLLRRLAYALPTSVLASAELARIRLGAGGPERIVLRVPLGAEALPLGTFFSERAPGLFVLAGHDLVPSCPPAQLARAAGADEKTHVFVDREPGDDAATMRAIAVPASAYVPLGEALISPESWGALPTAEVVELERSELDQRLGEVSMQPLGVLPMRGV